MKFFSFLIVTFLFIFGPVFNSIGSWADTILLISLILVLYNAFKSKVYLPYYIKIFFILIPLFIYVAVLISFYEGTVAYDYFQVLFRPIRIILTLLAGFSLMQLLRKHYDKNAFRVSLELIFFSVVLHAGIMAYQFYNIEFKDYIYSYTAAKGEFRSSFDYNFRMGGLSGGSGGSILSVVQSLGIVLLPFLIKDSSASKKIFYSISGLLIMYSILISGRSGFWSFLIFLPVSIYLSVTKIYVGTILKAIFVTLFSIISLFSLITILGALDETDPLFLALNRTLDTFIGFNTSGKFEDNTTGILINHILLPDNVLTFIFGNGEHTVNTQFQRTLDSDIGYIRNLWSFGIIGAIIFLIPILKYFFISFKLKNRYHEAALLFLLTLIMISFQFKENFMYVRMFFSIYSLAIAAFYLKQNFIKKEI